jgi:hypothetical protein
MENKMQWQPIETAPKDKYILLYRKAKNSQVRIVIGYWSESEFCFKITMTTKEVLNPVCWMDLPDEPE